MCACACVRACVRACARACVRACARARACVKLLVYSEYTMDIVLCKYRILLQPDFEFLTRPLNSALLGGEATFQEYEGWCGITGISVFLLIPRSFPAFWPHLFECIFARCKNCQGGASACLPVYQGRNGFYGLRSWHSTAVGGIWYNSMFGFVVGMGKGLSIHIGQDIIYTFLKVSLY